VLLLDRLVGIRGGHSVKGQVNPIDFMAAVFIFMVLFGYFMILWNMFSMRYGERSEILDCELGSISIADYLVNSRGYPINWTSAPLEARSIGFANKPNELDWSKVSSFASMNYSNQKKLLGTDNDFLIKIESSDGASYAQIGRPEGNQTYTCSIEVTRLAMLNGTIVNLRVKVYG
jgi:hypothetical protein